MLIHESTFFRVAWLRGGEARGATCGSQGGEIVILSTLYFLDFRLNIIVIQLKVLLKANY